ncbi:hypothetical protein CHS0354_039837 [Potamilus streckersoni]|uniref:Uncharacterized protein n=1 Tax=Potamilus streckersoni TaxID=2493646 RepID=A0AAE0SSF1_9BIVA|nr:hypothetical protein CHS0354_039837 [Potamilus streckersoni]
MIRGPDVERTVKNTVQCEDEYKKADVINSIGTADIDQSDDNEADKLSAMNADMSKLQTANISLQYERSPLLLVKRLRRSQRHSSERIMFWGRNGNLVIVRLEINKLLYWQDYEKWSFPCLTNGLFVIWPAAMVYNPFDSTRRFGGNLSC